jgi:cytochrome P450
MTTEDADPLEDEPELAGLTQAGLGYIRDPYPEFARLREQSPVTRQEAAFVGGPPSYVVYSHEGVTKVLRDADTYSSTIITEGMGQVWGPKIIVGMDEPDHRHHRALVSVAFRQRTLARWEESLVGRVVDDLIDGFVEQGEADLVSEFTFAFPAKVISGVLGLPEQDYQQFQRWAVGIISIGRDWERAVQCSNELREYLEAIVDARRVSPQDDLISELVTAQLDGEKLDDDEIYSFLRMLLPAGIETTYRSSGNLLFLLFTHPEQLEAIRTDRSLVPQAIEEGLRYESPVLLTTRVTTTDTVLGNVEIPAGSSVSPMLASANRDPEVFDEPEAFDSFREATRHLSFGLGPHLCLGLHLARLETTVALNALLDRLPNLRMDQGQAQRLDVHIGGDTLFRSPNHLPVIWDRQ